MYRPVVDSKEDIIHQTSVSDGKNGPRKVGPKNHISHKMKHSDIRKPKSRGIHACEVYGAFGRDTSKEPLEALRPIRVKVSKGRLHAWHVNT